MSRGIPEALSVSADVASGRGRPGAAVAAARPRLRRAPSPTRRFAREMVARAARPPRPAAGRGAHAGSARPGCLVSPRRGRGGGSRLPRPAGGAAHRRSRSAARGFATRGSAGRGPMGLGTEFERVREYSPDDDIRQVNWLATARMDRPMSNDYRIEQDRDVIAVVDAGPPHGLADRRGDAARRRDGRSVQPRRGRRRGRRPLRSARLRLGGAPLPAARARRRGARRQRALRHRARAGRLGLRASLPARRVRQASLGRRLHRPARGGRGALADRGRSGAWRASTRWPSPRLATPTSRPRSTTVPVRASSTPTAPRSRSTSPRRAGASASGSRHAGAQLVEADASGLGAATVGAYLRAKSRARGL